jgi:hypothetical protein
VDPTDPHQQLVAEKLTRETAERVRHLRVDLGYTWREVGDTLWKEWGEKGPGGYDIGFAACLVAADMLGEDGWQEPWA